MTAAGTQAAPLPDPWRDLEPLAARWSLPGEAERAALHRSASYAELEALYRTLLPRIPGMLEALNAVPLQRLQPGERRLLWLALAFVEAAVAVERFQCADMPPGAFAADRFHIATGTAV